MMIYPKTIAAIFTAAATVLFNEIFLNLYLKSTYNYRFFFGDYMILLWRIKGSLATMILLFLAFGVPLSILGDLAIDKLQIKNDLIVKGFLFVCSSILITFGPIIQTLDFDVSTVAQFLFIIPIYFTMEKWVENLLIKQGKKLVIRTVLGVLLFLLISGSIVELFCTYFICD